MRTCFPGAIGVPSSVVTTRRSSDSSEWNDPAVPSAHESLIVFGWLGSGPTFARPTTSDSVSQREKTVAQRGACRIGSHAAPPGLKTVTLTVALTALLPGTS